MNEQEGRDVVERLRRAAKAGAPVVELEGNEARSFVFVDSDERSILLGSFAITLSDEPKFFVSVVVKPNKTDDFQFFVMEKRKGSPVLGTSNIEDGGLRWRYSPTKQSGDNAARKQAFVQANGSTFIDIPLPDDDIAPFALAIRRAITQRHLADDDDAGATEASEVASRTMAAPDESQRGVVDGSPGGVSFDAIMAHLKSRSLSFSAETVATYLLALQARRFVLLTGISGTGKTQLALEVARIYAPKALATQQQADTVELVIQVDHVKRGRFVVPVRMAKQLDALYDEDRKRIDVRLSGRPAESMAIHKDPERPGLLMVLLSGEAKTAFQKTSTVGDRLLLHREVSGKTETLVVELPPAQEPLVLREPTHELIAVRPDWTDARALVGFYNPLTRDYISTPTLDLLQKAQTEVERSSAAGFAPRPYFLVFDEMNLARVEHYFSDFLSAMESGEEIHLHDDDELAERDDKPIPKRIRIPRNIFVIGTVNIDETTYMFSPKVLDRAFVLEFNHVDLDSLAGRSVHEDPASTPLALTRMGAALQLFGRSDDTEWLRFEAALDGELARQLKKVHAALTADNRHFGYRVAREIARFVDLAGEQSGGSPAAIRAAFDVAVLSKVLPKLHGGQGEIEGPLMRLFAVAIGSDPGSDDARYLDRFDVDGTRLARVDGGDDLPMPRTALKLWRMRLRLRTQGFVSFIE